MLGDDRQHLFEGAIFSALSRGLAVSFFRRQVLGCQMGGH